MAGRSNLNANCVDTEQIFDGCVTEAKIDPTLISSLNTALGTYSGIVAQATVTANGGAKQKVGGTLAVGTLIHTCIVYISEAWNGTGASLTVGHDGSAQTDYFIPAASFNASAGTVIGNDPSQCGIGLWTPAVQTTTASAWALSALHVDSGTHNMDTKTQGSTVGDYTVTTWPRRITTYVDPTFDAQTYAYVTKGTGQTTYTGKAVITLYGVVPAGGSV